MRWVRRRVPPALVALLFAATAALGTATVLGTATGAQAHDSLQGTSPEQGSSLTVAPTVVKLTFNDPVLSGTAQVRVTGPAGEASTGAVNALGDTVAVALLPNLVNGTYTVDWRVTSNDGHPVAGRFTFTLNAAGGASAPAAPAPSPSLDLTPVPPKKADPPSQWPVVAALVVTLLGAGGVFALVSRRRQASRGSGTG